MVAATNLNAREQAVFDTLPAQGEITHEAWKQAIVSAGLHGDMKMTQALRRNKAVSFRLDASQPEAVLYVSRASAGGGGSSITLPSGGD